MMDKHDQFFTPDQIDEQIEQSADARQNTPETRLLSEMQHIAQQIRAEHELSLQRVEDRLLKYHLTGEKRPGVASEPREAFSPQEISQGSFSTMKNTAISHSGKMKFGRRISLLAATLLVIALVGSLLIVLNSARGRSTSVASGRTATPTPKPPNPSFGKTLYTTPANQWGFSALSWSSHSDRVAALLIDSVQIWDATTGRHQITIKMPDASELVRGMSWSPDGKFIAIGTSKYMRIADSQTGHILHTYTLNSASVSYTTVPNSPYLATLMPASGGYGFWNPVWSPDGHLVASTLFSADQKSKIQVWNPQTGTVAFEIAGGTQYIGVDGWSSDGQYLAGVLNDMNGGLDAVNYVVAWQVSTRQIVFKQKATLTAGVVWQPHSNNLAFVSFDRQAPGTIQIWNILSGTLVQSHQDDSGSANGHLAWSPDGQELAYDLTLSPSNVELTPNSTTPTPGAQPSAETASLYQISIWDVRANQIIFTYNGHHNRIACLAWSPNGKYIVSGEGETSGNMVAKVWKAA